MCLMHAFHFASTSNYFICSCVRRCWLLFRPLFWLNQFWFHCATDRNQHIQCFYWSIWSYCFVHVKGRELTKRCFAFSVFDVVNCMESWQMFPLIWNLMKLNLWSFTISKYCCCHFHSSVTHKHTHTHTQNENKNN